MRRLSTTFKSLFTLLLASCISFIIFSCWNLQYFMECSNQHLRLVGRMAVESDMQSAPDFRTIRVSNGIPRNVHNHHKPSFCRPLYHVAIIVPSRNRERQFRLLLHHLYPFLMRQQVSFTIYVVSQGVEGIFNRAKLFNVGIKEALKDMDFDCFIFHDTDLEDDNCLYQCSEEHPIHLSALINTFSYESMNYSLNCAPPGFPNVILGFGGVSAMTRKQVEDVNGFSNKYWGWGGEDDDMFIRAWRKGYSVKHVFGNHCSYTMLEHDHEATNRVNIYRHKLLKDSINRIDADGLNSVSYNVVSVQRNPLFTNITVEIGNESTDDQYAEDLSNDCGFYENE